MFRTILLTVVLTGITLAEKWDLQQCLNFGLENNSSYQIQLLELRADSSRLKQAKAALLPSLNGSAGTSYSAPSEGSSGRTSMELSSRILLFDGFQTPNTIKQKQQEIERESLSLEQSKRALFSDITSAYLAAYYAHENSAIASEAVLQAQNQETQTAELVASGRAVQADLITSKATLAQKQYEQTSAKNAERSATLTLQQLLQLPVNQLLHLYFPKSVEEISEITLPTAETVMQKIAESHPTVQAALLETALAETQKRIARGGFIPSLYASGALSTGTSSSSADPYGEQLGDRFTPSVGLSLSIPIYDNRKTKTAVELAEISLQQQKISQQEVIQSLYLTVEKHLQDLENSTLLFLAADQQYKALKANYETVQEQYKSGRIDYYSSLTETERYNNALRELNKARVSMLLQQQLLNIFLGEPVSLPQSFSKQ